MHDGIGRVIDFILIRSQYLNYVLIRAFPFVCRRDFKARAHCLHATPEPPCTGLTFHSPVNCRFCITGTEHGCKSNETMGVYCDPRILLIRLVCSLERGRKREDPIRITLVYQHNYYLSYVFLHLSKLDNFEIHTHNNFSAF